MSFRIIRRLIYLKSARHRRGHGIHSPFLFHLITTVVEDKTNRPEYELHRRLILEARNLLENSSRELLDNLCSDYHLTVSTPRKIIQKVELPSRYAKLIFRLIGEFNPSSVINCGPAFGAALALMAKANHDSFVYQMMGSPGYELIYKELLSHTAIQNIQVLGGDTFPSLKSCVILINYPHRPDLTRNVAEKILSLTDDNLVLIIRGIRESKEMRVIWREVIASQRVRVSLDLFEIGIILFYKGLQKENFVYRL